MWRRRALFVLVLVLPLSWRPFLEPAGQATVLIADLFARALIGVDVGTVIAPPVREEETRERFAGVEMRVSWWRPGLGTSHPAVLIVNGATELGNDNSATRSLGRALARAGFLAMLPELPFLLEGRFDPAGTGQIDEAFALLRALPETRGRPVGAFGSSVGGGVLLVAAGREAALRGASYVVVLGAYFDMHTYLASVVSETQVIGGERVPWQPSEEAQRRLVPAALASMATVRDRDALDDALRARGYDRVLLALGALPSSARERLDALSPRTVWPAIVAPIHWIHDPDDAYEPPAEAEAAMRAPRTSTFDLMVPRLIQHAEPSAEAKARGPLYVLGELGRLVGFAFEVLRAAD